MTLSVLLARFSTYYALHFSLAKGKTSVWAVETTSHPSNAMPEKTKLTLSVVDEQITISMNPLYKTLISHTEFFLWDLDRTYMVICDIPFCVSPGVICDILFCVSQEDMSPFC